jgi:4-alpha-methyl-delta7-sterol-4alpha-methyl oxidase
MSTLLDIYSEPLFFWLVLGTTAVSMVSFLLFAVPWSLLAWKDPESLREYRIQRRSLPASRVVWPSVKRWFVNNVALTAVVVVAWPLIRHTAIHIGPLPPWYEFAWQIPFFILLDDFLYYWMHRTLHWGPLYRRIHSVHHRMSAPWAISAHYMHPVEFILTGLLMLLGPALVGAHIAVIWLWVVIRQWEAAEGHCGYDIPWNPTHKFPLYHGPAYHDFHHSRFTGNYAGALGYLDRFFGKYSRDYEKYREEHEG